MAILVRYGEIALKGNNRPYFEKQLVKNIKFFNPELKVERKVGRMVIATENRISLDNIYGITSYSHASVVPAEMEKINEEALKYYTKGAFKVETQRLTKEIKESREISSEVGAYIVGKTAAKVNLGNPECTIYIEIIDKKAYIFNEKRKGLGGLPAGVEGTVAVLLEDKNSIEAAKAMLKRGCKVILVRREDVKIEELEKYCPFKLKVVDDIPEYAEAIVTSETLETLKERDFKQLVLKPLLIPWQK